MMNKKLELSKCFEMFMKDCSDKSKANIKAYMNLCWTSPTIGPLNESPQDRDYAKRLNEAWLLLTKDE